MANMAPRLLTVAALVSPTIAVPIVEQPPIWCTQPRYVLSHHRAAGSVAHDALRLLNNALLQHCPPNSVRLILFAQHGTDLNATGLPSSCSRVASRSSSPSMDVEKAIELGKISMLPSAPAGTQVQTKP